MNLPKNAWNCPKDNAKLWFKNHAGLLVIESGSLKAKCPTCNSYYDVEPKSKTK